MEYVINAMRKALDEKIKAIVKYEEVATVRQKELEAAIHVVYSHRAERDQLIRAIDLCNKDQARDDE